MSGLKNSVHSYLLIFIILLLILPPFQAFTASENINLFKTNLKHFLYQENNESSVEEITDEKLDSLEDWLDAGFIFREHAMLGHAALIYQKALMKFPDSPELLLAAGRASFMGGELEDALSYLEKLSDMNISPHVKYEAHLLEALVLFDMERFSRAITAAREAIKYFPDGTIARLVLARALVKQKKYEEALQILDQLLKLDNNQFEARVLRAEVLMELDRPEDARREAWKIKASDSMHPVALQILEKTRKTEPPVSSQEETKKEDKLAREGKALEKIKGLTVTPVKNAESIPLLRVGISTTTGGKPATRKTLCFKTSGDYMIREKNSKKEFKIEKDKIYAIRTLKNNSLGLYLAGTRNELATFNRDIEISPLDKGRSTIAIEGIEFGAGSFWAGAETRHYRGNIEIKRMEDKFYLVNVLNMEEYLYGVLPGEMPPRYPDEAKKAQVVAARSEAFHKQRYIKKHTRYGYEVCDDQCCQCYKGAGAETPETNRLVDETRGYVLEAEGRICDAVYSNNCGGHTQNSEDNYGWGISPYLKGVSDERHPSLVFPLEPGMLEKWLRYPQELFCASSERVSNSESRWTRMIPAEQATRHIAKNYDIGQLKKVIITGRTSRGYVSSFLLVGDKRSETVRDGSKLRSRLTPGGLKSHLLLVDNVMDKNGKLKYLLVSGAGWGHGVGMCQNGAAGRALAGWSFKKILLHYFRNASLNKIY